MIIRRPVCPLGGLLTVNVLNNWRARKIEEKKNEKNVQLGFLPDLKC